MPMFEDSMDMEINRYIKSLPIVKVIAIHKCRDLVLLSDGKHLRTAKWNGIEYKKGERLRLNENGVLY